MHKKSENINVRVTQEFKVLLKEAAERQHRTVSNFIEALVREHCEKADPRRRNTARGNGQ